MALKKYRWTGYDEFRDNYNNRTIERGEVVEIQEHLAEGHDRFIETDPERNYILESSISTGKIECPDIREEPFKVYCGLVEVEDKQTAETLIEEISHLTLKSKPKQEQEEKEYTEIVREQSCGNPECSSCPHGPYKYHVYNEDGSQRWEYKGKVF